MYLSLVSFTRLLTISQILGWSGWIRVDGSLYQLWGQTGVATNLSSIEITPTSTILSVVADTVNVNVTFLSPIEVRSLIPLCYGLLTFLQPSNLALQSLPFSYISVDATSNDGASHTIQLYSDISCGASNNCPRDILIKSVQNGCPVILLAWYDGARRKQIRLPITRVLGSLLKMP